MVSLRYPPKPLLRQVRRRRSEPWRRSQVGTPERYAMRGTDLAFGAASRRTRRVRREPPQGEREGAAEAKARRQWPCNLTLPVARAGAPSRLTEAGCRGAGQIN
eukprot:2633245-Rhodomonas_salina.1